MSSETLSKHTWGAFGNKFISRSPYGDSDAPKYTSRWFSDESLNDGPWNEQRVNARYYQGADILIRETPSHVSALEYVFPYEFYVDAQRELKYLLSHVPDSKNLYAQIAWCIHTSFCVYGMYFAMNGYPGFWKTALSFANNIDYLPPETGWAPTFPSIDVAMGKGAGVHASYTDSVTHPFELMWTSEEGYSSAGSIYMWRWQRNMPWCGVFRNHVLPPLLDEIAKATKQDKNQEQGLALLVLRASSLANGFPTSGGLDQIVSHFETAKDKVAFANACVKYWKTRGTEIVNLEYWKFVRGGVAAWKWYCVLSLCVNKLGVSNQDMLTLYTAHNDQRKTIFKGQLVGLLMHLGKVIYKCVGGDLIGAGKAYYDGVKWEKAQNKVADSAIPPYEGAFVFPNIFIRGFADSKYTFDVFGDNTATICSEGGNLAAFGEANCESVTGTASLLVNLETHVHNVENLINEGGILNVTVWNPPAVLVTKREATVSDWRKVGTALKPKSEEKPSSANWWVDAVPMLPDYTTPKQNTVVAPTVAQRKTTKLKIAVGVVSGLGLLSTATWWFLRKRF